VLSGRVISRAEAPSASESIEPLSRAVLAQEGQQLIVVCAAIAGSFPVKRIVIVLPFPIPNQHRGEIRVRGAARLKNAVAVRAPIQLYPKLLSHMSVSWRDPTPKAWS